MSLNPAPELAPQLKELRLSGIFDSLEARNRQAIEAKMAYTDFLAMLISDEVARRESEKFDMRLRRAQFRTTKTLEQFDFERLPQLNRALVHDLATGRYLQEKAPVLIVGPCGTGKSHLAQALGHCAVRQGLDVVLTTCASLTQSLNAARATGSYERKLATLARVPLLIIDDFGLKPLRAPADEDLHDLIAERYEQAATIVTSNLAPIRRTSVALLRRSVTGRPVGEFCRAHGLEKRVVHPNCQPPRLTVCRRWRQRHQPRTGLARLRQHDFFACMRAVEKLGEMRLGVMNVDQGGHGFSRMS